MPKVAAESIPSMPTCSGSMSPCMPWRTSDSATPAPPATPRPPRIPTPGIAATAPPAAPAAVSRARQARSRLPDSPPQGNQPIDAAMPAPTRVEPIPVTTARSPLTERGEARAADGLPGRAGDRADGAQRIAVQPGDVRAADLCQWAGGVHDPVGAGADQQRPRSEPVPVLDVPGRGRRGCRRRRRPLCWWWRRPRRRPAVRPSPRCRWRHRRQSRCRPRRRRWPSADVGHPAVSRGSFSTDPARFGASRRGPGSTRQMSG
jgi:hypothetical protein